MDILLVSATAPEIVPTVHFLEQTFTKTAENKYSSGNLNITILNAGVGILSTAFNLTSVLVHHKYTLVINAGIAGIFNKEVALGTLFNVVSESVPELGAEDGDDFISVFELNLLDKNAFPFNEGRLENDTQIDIKVLNDLKPAHGITVNKVHGNDVTIIKLLSRLTNKPDLESMEGAAFAYVCEHKKQAYVQIRSASNYIERRNRAAWNIGLAVKNLNDKLIELIEELKNK